MSVAPDVRCYSCYVSQNLRKSAKLTHLGAEADQLAVDGDSVVGEVRVHVARVDAGADQPPERGREERRPRDGLPPLPRRVEERQRGRVGGKRPSCFERAISSSSFKHHFIIAGILGRHELTLSNLP